MRTTLNISDELLALAKARALRTHRRLGDVVDDALRKFFSERRPTQARLPVRLPTDGGSGLQPGVDLDDKEALAELLGDNDPVR